MTAALGIVKKCDNSSNCHSSAAVAAIDAAAIVVWTEQTI